MTKLYLVHGWDGSSDSEPWFGWLKKECEKRSIEFHAPIMPDADEPMIEKWVGKLKEIVDASEDCYFVGHSIGCQTIMRYLENAPAGLRVKGIVFVAPWLTLTGLETEEERETARPWLETPIDFEKVKKVAGKISAIFSTDDPFVPLSNMKLFERKLDAEVIVKNNEGHFNETKEINEIMEFIDNG